MKQQVYEVKRIFGRTKEIIAEVPGSKSITNRALLLAALARGKTRLSGALFSEDSKDMVNCLISLGFSIETSEETREFFISGTGGKIPRKEGEVNVGNAGTAARFITALLAFSGGVYRADAGEQMRKRPMKPLISALRSLGARIVCEGEEGYFPFLLDAREVKGGELRLDTELSSQFLSALLMAGVLSEEGLKIRMTGRKKLPYVEMTLRMMRDFGIRTAGREGDVFFVNKGDYQGRDYEIEPDVSAACYFYGMATILGVSALVKGVRKNGIQGDLRFLEVLQEFGLSVTEEEEGIRAEGKKGVFRGIEADLSDCSDQTMTLAAISLFASSPTRITGISHIGYQESDRLRAIQNEVGRLGGEAEIRDGELLIFPIREGAETGEPVEVETYGDHRMAMAFTIAGLRKGGVRIKDPACSHKTFKEYFDIIDRITHEEDDN